MRAWKIITSALVAILLLVAIATILSLVYLKGVNDEHVELLAFYMRFNHLVSKKLDQGKVDSAQQDIVGLLGSEVRIYRLLRTKRWIADPEPENSSVDKECKEIEDYAAARYRL